MKKNIVTIISLFLLWQVSVYAQTPNTILLSIPSEDWGLSVNLKGFEIEKNNLDSETNSRYLLATKKDGTTVVSIFIEKADHKGDPIESRSYYWEKASKAPFTKENLKQYEKSNIAFVEYDVETFQGKKVDFHSLNAYLSYKDYWIDVHITKTSYKESDKELFNSIINSLNFNQITINDLIASASIAFYSGNYPVAISNYEQVLEMEKQKKTIDRTIWFTVVDNLGMSYGITGDLNNAKRIFEYGITLEPEYPLFYYNMACVYAESSDLDNMLVNLELALSKKENIIKGEKFPDPRKDSSFKKYLKNEQFKQLLKKYKM